MVTFTRDPIRDNLSPCGVMGNVVDVLATGFNIHFRPNRSAQGHRHSARRTQRPRTTLVRSEYEKGGGVSHLIALGKAAANHQAKSARLRQRNRRTRGGVNRNHVCRRNRNRPVRRTSCACAAAFQRIGKKAGSKRSFEAG